MTFLSKPVIAATPAETRIVEATFEAGPAASPVPAHVEVAARRYSTLDVSLDATSGIFWCHMKPAGRPSFTPELLHEISDMQLWIEQMFQARSHERKLPFQYFVMGSRLPGIFNLGGDLGLFAERIRQGDRATMREYGHVAVEAIYRNHVAFRSPVVTMALVQGDALGGGFECALSLDLIVAERSAKLGLPEILFNLFPGMGAYSFLSRRLDAQRAEKMITSGKIYTAAELHEMGVVDVLAEDGEGELAIEEYVEKNRRKHNAHQAVLQARRRVNPVTLDELRDVVDIWVEAALRLEEPDLRKMVRLTQAQDRRRAAVNASLMVAAE
ncbi:crotonase/enoyl-CoA hydratase family protein [Roseomonas sp. NAR14]|uniref:Crotonase/enoyl-CoA hydratase family protein n=1 Tax=Roseomonas acroporae TaxID=2937791 RepID=A0A9X1Y509_9PROT|nr:crotonase/enoyl-CoA hydratase family protein [Roseomonas acroporae]MCK8784074.1 crotonase/enoyl-CoA hydratase family protein [Roseomonas acroporae]